MYCAILGQQSIKYHKCVNASKKVINGGTYIIKKRKGQLLKKDKEPPQNNIQSKIPKLPDPGCEAIRFLSWLKKRGTTMNLSLCIRKWEREGLDIEDIIRTLGNAVIQIYLNRGQKGSSIIR